MSRWLLNCGIGLITLNVAATEILSPATDFSTQPVHSTDIHVILVSRQDCQYCDTVRRDFLVPLSKHPQFTKTVFIHELKIDGATTLQDFNQQSVSPADFAAHYGVSFTPTVLFLSSSGQPLHPPLIGISNADFYGYYLDKAVAKSRAKALNN